MCVLVTDNLSCVCVLSALSSAELAATFTPYDLKRLEMYSRNMVDYHLIMDMIPVIARMYFLKQLGNIGLSVAQSVSQLCVLLRFKSKYKNFL